MNIYRVELTDTGHGVFIAWYTEVVAQIVAAETKEEARKLAYEADNDATVPEKKELWLSQDHCIVFELDIKIPNVLFQYMGTG